MPRNMIKDTIKDVVRWIRIVLLRLFCCNKRDISVPTGPIIIVAPHPDDEVIGCGGLIQRLVKQGCDVHVVLMTGGEASHQNCCHISKDRIKDVRRSLCMDIDSRIGVDKSHIHLLDYPDGGIQVENEETEHLQALISSIKPDVLFVPHGGEGWPDHINTREIIRSVVKQNAIIYEYCVWMWYYNVWQLNWENARLLRMTREEHAKKLKAVNEYVTPQAPCGNPWSGVLPAVFLHANKWNKELFFECK